MQLKVVQSIDADFKVKALEDGSVYLEGWANKAVVDRGKDLIGKKAWNVDNYKKNSIMLFNHDHSKPIGKMMSVEPRDEGLYVKGRISNSKDPEISRIRDLVKEGILNSLSVGIMVSDEEQKDGVNHVKAVELHEVSVVAVPMNQDSQFSVSTKAMSGTMLDTMQLITAATGFKDVEKACKILHADEAVYESIDQIADKIAKECSIDKEKSLEFLRLHLPETPIEIKSWLDKTTEDAPKGEEGKAQLDGAEVQSISVPKDAVASMEELQAWAKESGWSTADVQEDDTSYLLVQKPVDAFDGDLRSIDMGDGVVAMVGKLKEVKKEEKGLLDDSDPTTQPITGQVAGNIEVNPSLDQAKQTNVLLANVVSLLQQMSGKLDMLSEPREPVGPTSVEVGEVEPVEDETQLAKKIESFMIKTSERLSQLGL